MGHFRVISKFVFDEGSEGYIPEITIDYTSLNQVADLVVKDPLPPDPNVGVFSVDQGSGNGVVTQIRNDPKYGLGAVLLDHNDEGTIPDDALFNATKTYLIGLGMTQAQVDEALGATVSDRTRFKISNDFIAWLKAH